MNRLNKRVVGEAKYRNVNTKLKNHSWLIMCFLLTITFVCSLVYISRLLKAVNKINIHHNIYGDFLSEKVKHVE